MRTRSNDRGMCAILNTFNFFFTNQNFFYLFTNYLPNETEKIIINKPRFFFFILLTRNGKHDFITVNVPIDMFNNCIEEGMYRIVSRGGGAVG